MPRGRRAAEGREINRREASKRAMPDVSFRGVLYFPREEIPEDKEYFWIAETCLNAPLDNNVTQALMAGWSPVPADRHPNHVAPPLPGREGVVQNVIRRGGQLLCEIDKNKFRKMNDERRQKSLAQIKAVSRALADGPQKNPTMPFVVDDDRTYVEKRTFKE